VLTKGNSRGFRAREEVRWMPELETANLPMWTYLSAAFARVSAGWM